MAPRYVTGLERNEILDDIFQHETGKLAVGKDMPAAANETDEQREERKAIWIEWMKSDRLESAIRYISTLQRQIRALGEDQP